MIKRIGNRVILVGVAHVLPESREEVIQTIREEEPDIVGVELCRKRYLQLTSESQEKNSGITLSRTAILAKILRFLQEKIGERTGMLPGEEMKAAIDEARKMGADVQLIDRDINLTLQRLLNKMTLMEKIKILGEVLLSPLKFSEDIRLEDLTKEEIIEELLSEIESLSKTTYNVLIKERDQFMADRITNTLRSGTEKIVCVVGAGHIPGLSEELEDRFEEGILEPWDSYQLEWSL